jgi:hypothetical protein
VQALRGTAEVQFLGDGDEADDIAKLPWRPRVVAT